MEGNLSRSAETTNLRYRLDGAHFVVGIHHRNEDRLVSYGPRNIIRVHLPIAINRQVGRFEAKTLQVLAGVQYSMVFYRRGDNMLALFLCGKGYAFNSEVVALRATSRKGDFRRARVQNFGDLFTSAINSLHGMTPQCIDTAGVA